ncbi:MAG: RNA methyltransferase, partial [Rhizobiales bacterium]|nr:RNA methyltransferase [Hyphomicrobiales bacterium]
TPAIILVEPQLGDNIGAAARAMANFGLADLRLVAPRDGWPSKKARAVASGAVGVLDAARVFDTPEAAVADLNFVYATTARGRDLPKTIVGPREAVGELKARAAQAQATGILFGRERWGLTNEEIALADAIVTFPVNPAFASLNIAQAVLLMSYEWMSAGLDGALPARAVVTNPDLTPAPKEQLIGLIEQLESALDGRGYFRTPEKKPTMVHNLRAFLQRAGLTTPEIHMLRGVIASLERRHEKRTSGASDA